MTVSNELIDQLLAGYKKPEDLIGENGLLKQLTKRLVERALEAEMTEHLGHTNNASVANTAGNAHSPPSGPTPRHLWVRVGTGVASKLIKAVVLLWPFTLECSPCHPVQP